MSAAPDAHGAGADPSREAHDPGATASDERAARVRESRARALLDRALSASAGIVALCALGVSVYQAYVGRQQQKLAVWPYYAGGNSFPGDGKPYTYIVSNQGVGPMLVESVQLLVDGRPQPTWVAARRALGVPDARVTRDIYSTFRAGTVMLPGAERTIMETEGAGARDFWAAGQERLELRVCYCSLYDDCWTTQGGGRRPRPVRTCPSSPADSVWKN